MKDQHILLYMWLKFDEDPIIWWIFIELNQFLFHLHYEIKFNYSRCNLNLEMKIGLMNQHILLYMWLKFDENPII